MDYIIHIDTVRMELFILYYKGSQVELSKIWCISDPEDCFILANSVGPNLGIHCLQSTWIETG